jgi:hypothetical protein
MTPPNHRSIRKTQTSPEAPCERLLPVPDDFEPEWWPTENMLASLGLISLATKARLRGLHQAGKEV